MKEKNLKGKKVYLRYPKIEDLTEFTELNKASLDFHEGLVNPPLDQKTFTGYINKNECPENECFLICSIKTDEIAGAINFSQIFRAGFQNAYLGYYVGEKFAGKGFATEAIELIIKFAFEELNLHRIEANIQPQNLPSIAVVKKNGFVKEGFSLKYLQVDGIWCDHERWAIINKNWKNKK